MKQRPTIHSRHKTPMTRGEPVVRKILQAALEELSAHGYEGIRIEDVAQRAGVNKTTVYRRWATKADLVRTVLMSLQRERLAEVPDNGSLRSDLLYLVGPACHGGHSVEGRTVVHALAAEGSNPEVKAVALALMMTREKATKLVLERAVARGEVGRSTDLTPVLDVLRALSCSPVMRPGKELDAKRSKAIIDVLLNGLLSKHAHSG